MIKLRQAVVRFCVVSVILLIVYSMVSTTLKLNVQFKLSTTTSLDDRSIVLRPETDREPYSDSILDTPGLKCAPWEVSLDEWWQDHPEWEPRHENRTHTCFAPIENEAKAIFYRTVHHLQFHSNCSGLNSRTMTQSGFAASTEFILTGFWSAFRQFRPFQQSKYDRTEVWLYTAPYNASNPTLFTCESNDMFCYFLDISDCEYEEGISFGLERKHYLDVRDKLNLNFTWIRYAWLQSYLLRPRQALRRRLVEFLDEHAPKVPTPCTAFHVRRTDATTEKHPRFFYPLSLYLEKGNVKKGESILLLTDDSSTIDEARAFHPEYNWLFVDRKRNRGGRKNQHIPSGDHAFEVLVIMAELKLAEKCHTLVHGTSNFIHMIERAIAASSGRMLHTIQVDLGMDFSKYEMLSGEKFLHDLDAKLKMTMRNNTSLAESNASAV